MALSFSTDRNGIGWELDLLNSTEDWCWARLEQFKNKPIVNVRKVDQIAEQIESLIDEKRVSCFSDVKEAIKQEHKQRLSQQMVLAIRALLLRNVLGTPRSHIT